MSQESAFEFVGRIKTDAKFRREYLKAKAKEKPDLFLQEMGFSFSLAELQVARLKHQFSPTDSEIWRDLNSSLDSLDLKMDPDEIVAAFCGCEEPEKPKSQRSGG